jgi:DNA-binding GntR family transcriptional regulator
MKEQLLAVLGTDEGRLHGRVTTILRDAIIHGRLRPGARLSEVELSQEFGMSRSPIREAFVQLAQEGFVERSETGRVYVRPLDLDEAKQLYVVRANLEALTARLAAENITRRQTHQLEVNIEAMQAACEAGDAAAAMACGAEFHRVIIEASGNRPLEETLGGLRARTSRYRFILASQNEFKPARVREHQRIVSALRAQSPDRAVLAMLTHIEESARETVEALTDYLREMTPTESTPHVARRR